MFTQNILLFVMRELGRGSQQVTLSPCIRHCQNKKEKKIRSESGFEHSRNAVDDSTHFLAPVIKAMLNHIKKEIILCDDDVSAPCDYRHFISVKLVSRSKYFAEAKINGNVRLIFMQKKLHDKW